ncbi:hypothetical protein [Ferruginibacter albus]|uniref:hypothetical protein n=1 Tax=Ferruginibacter albus TaxID=2875540 RepID=UPI001CC79267|nr:hypothetical protein [Ferruginibacter albus]UAY51113.1 hypothetical protein K9M53_10980 [Ferruginibacter albus]
MQVSIISYPAYLCHLVSAMQHSIASYLFRNKNCFLPGIGELKIVRTPANTDFFTHQIKAPVEVIEFTPYDEKVAVFNELSAESQHLKMLLDTENNITLEGVGTFSKSNNGEINFVGVKVAEIFNQPVRVETISHQPAAYTETKSVVQRDVLPETVVQHDSTLLINDNPLPKKERWWIAAVIIGVIGLGALLFNISQNGSTSGNIISIPSKSPVGTYDSVTQ